MEARTAQGNDFELILTVKIETIDVPKSDHLVVNLGQSVIIA